MVKLMRERGGHGDLAISVLLCLVWGILRLQPRGAVRCADKVTCLYCLAHMRYTLLCFTRERLENSLIDIGVKLKKADERFKAVKRFIEDDARFEL